MGHQLLCWRFWKEIDAIRCEGGLDDFDLNFLYYKGPEVGRDWCKAGEGKHHTWYERLTDCKPHTPLPETKL